MPNKKDKKAEMKKAVPDKNAESRVWQPHIAVVGIGGGGSTIVSEIAKKIYHKKLPHLNKIQFIAANVDSQALRSISGKTKPFAFGKNFTKGLGCGMNPDLGEKAAEEAKKRIKKILQKSDFCIFVTCLGGGTGSGSAPIFTRIAKEMGILSWGIFTRPFRFEGKERVQIAKNALKKTVPFLDSFTIMYNQRIFKIVETKTSLQKSLSAMNNLLADALEGLIETLYAPGLINLDFSDIKTVLQSTSANKATYLHSQECGGKERAEKTIQAVLKNPLIQHKIIGAEKILFNIGGSKDMKMAEVEKISKEIAAFNPNAKIIFGVMQNGHYEGKIRITLLAVGCGKTQKKKKERKTIKKPVQKPAQEPAKPSSSAKPEKAKNPKKTKTSKPKKKKVKTASPHKSRPKNKKTIKEKKEEEPLISEKKTVRRNALDLHRQAKENEEKMLEEETKWDIPAFLRAEKK